MIATRLKQPGETLRFAPAFATTAALVQLVDVTVEARGLVPGAPACQAQGEIAGGVLELVVAGGGDGERYLVTARVDDADGQTLESELEIAVIESAWQLPDGGTPYLSIGDFVARFGLDEVVRMTDPDGSGRIDRDLLTNALADAQAIADAELAGRYAVPLATVPKVIELAIADIARARLYPQGAPDGVDRAAKAAARSLERIASGELTLGLPERPAEAASDTPVLIAPGRRVYRDGCGDW
ncbi:MAG TPA: DUF1320 domain-containing protein [Sphingomonas sp.]|nr:DUF1320 domain-containing protein [Sphingomonas sp.]